MDQERMEGLMALWESETEDKETWEWRENLTPEEARLVESWDSSWNSGVLKLSEDILAADQRLVRKEPAEIVGIAQKGVPVGLFGRLAPGFVLENSTVLLESEKDANGFYIGGAGMDGMYMCTPERYEPVRDDAGQLTGFRSISKYVAAFSSEELGLIYSYALFSGEDLVKNLNADCQRLSKDPETQALYASTAEKLEQVPPDERSRLVAGVYAAWKDRHMEDLRGRQKAAEQPLTGIVGPPIGRIDYLAPNGTVAESIEYTDRERFQVEIEEDTHYGIPFSVVLYRDEYGKTIPRDFLLRLDPPPKGFSVVDREQDHRLSVQDQLDAATREAGQRNAERQTVRAAALEAER